jgi:hypothetical protein
MGLPRAVADQLAAIPSKVVALQSAWTATVTPGNGEQWRQCACRLLPAVSWRDGGCWRYTGSCEIWNASTPGCLVEAVTRSGGTWPPRAPTSTCPAPGPAGADGGATVGGCALAGGGARPLSANPASGPGWRGRRGSSWRGCRSCHRAVGGGGGADWNSAGHFFPRTAPSPSHASARSSVVGHASGQALLLRAAGRCAASPRAIMVSSVDNIHVAAPQPGARSRTAPADTGPSARLAAVGLSTLALASICSLSTRPGTSHLAGAATSVGDVEVCGCARVRRPSFPLAVGADQRDKGPELVRWFCFVSTHMKPKIVLFLWDPGGPLSWTCSYCFNGNHR